MLLNFLTDGAVSEIRGRMWKSTPPKATLSGKRENKKTDSNLGCIFQIALKTNKVHSLCKGFLFHVLFLSSYFYWNIQQAPLPRRELVVLPLLDKWRQYNSHSKIHQCPLKDKSTTFAPPPLSYFRVSHFLTGGDFHARPRLYHCPLSLRTFKGPLALYSIQNLAIAKAMIYR